MKTTSKTTKLEFEMPRISTRSALEKMLRNAPMLDAVQAPAGFKIYYIKGRDQYVSMARDNGFMVLTGQTPGKMIGLYVGKDDAWDALYYDAYSEWKEQTKREKNE